MARYGQRPENALKRANEFMELDKPARALDTLQEVFRNKKWAFNWSDTVLEPIMFRYLELCVELRKSHIAKEGLFQYRNMFQSVNVVSLEMVIRGYLRMAEERTEAAREQSQQAVIETDDLDNLATPESILLSAVSGEDAQDRSDRTILTPWVKFLWESYCQCLELLRINAHVETLYHDIARMAFKFCLKYARKTEFRKLCDKLRKHLEDICKVTVQTGNVSITKPETQQLNLETRLFQLDSAIQMELWQEAYKAIEDIHNLMIMSKKAPVPKTKANYFSKLALVLWKAGHNLFHAAALLKLFQLNRDMKKNMSPEELHKMACRVLVATLSIPLPSSHPEFDRFVETDKSPVEKAQRLAVLLELPTPPTRTSLLKDVVRLNVVSLASPQLQKLHHWLHTEVDPLNMCLEVSKVIDTLQAPENTLSQYTSALRDVALVRLVGQVAQCYQRISIERLLELARTDDWFRLERMLVDCVRHNDMQIRIDHSTKSVSFGVDAGSSEWSSGTEDDGGACLQPMPSEQVRAQLVRSAEVLSQCVAIIRPACKRAERERARQAMVHHYHENKHAEHQRVLQRQKIIEDRKEYIERLNTVREEELLRRQEEQQRQAAAAEARRLEQERDERERRRLANEQKEMRERHVKERMALISQTSRGQDIIKKLEKEDITKLDAEMIAAREQEELIKERREQQAKLKSQEKKIDYLERAKRLEEIPLLQKSLEEKQVQDKAFFELQEKERIEALIEARARDVAAQARMVRMHAQRDEFVAKLRAERGAEYAKKLSAFEQKLAAEREKRLAERRQQRIQKRRQEWLAEKEAAAERAAAKAKRIREEEERKAREERERKLAEEEKERREKKEREQREHAEMLARAEAKARAREAEIQQKLDREREQVAQTATWRRGEEEKKDSWRAARPRDPNPRSPERRGPAREDRPLERGPPKEDNPIERPPREDRHIERAPLRDDRPIERGPARDDGPIERGPGRDDRPIERGPRDDRPIERGLARDDRPIERGPPRDERPIERAGPRDDKPIERGPSRDIRPTERGPPRDDRPIERAPLREDRDRGPIRDDRERGAPRDEGGWRGAREPEKSRYGGRSSAPDSGNSWRRPPAEPLDRDRDRDRDRPMDRGSDRPMDRGSDRPMDRGSDRPMDRGSWRSARDGPRDGPRDRDGPPRDRDGPPSYRDGPPRRDFGGFGSRRDDRDGPRRDDRDGPRRDDRDGPRRDDRDGPRRDDRDGPKREERKPMPRREEKPRDPDGWEPVTRR